MTSIENLPISSPPRSTTWFLPVRPYDYQWECYEKTVEHIRATIEPGYIYASVSAGKTIMMAMIAKRAQQIAADTGRQQLRILSIARTGELVEQNSDEMWTVGKNGTGSVRNSIFSASIGLKKTKYPVIVGSEGTVCRSLFSEGIAGKEDEEHTLRDKVFDLVLVDECLTGDALIDTSKGKIKISQLDCSTKIYCICEETGNIRLDYPVRVFSNGIRNISLIVTSYGVLRCTNTHRLLSEGSWISVKEMKAGDYLTLNGSQDFVLKKLLRASVAVVKRLFQTPAQNQAGSI